MKKTIYLKFVLAYVIFGFFGFLIVATFVSNMISESIKREKAEVLYQEATQIANTYASDIYKKQTSLESVKTQLDALSAYFDASIWIINPSGLVIVDTENPIDVVNPRTIENFDPTIIAGSYYTVGHFFDSFEEEQLSVFAPITSDFHVKGYVVILVEMSQLKKSINNMMNISYLLMCILFLLSLIILIFFTQMVYLPLRKITYATEQYADGNMHYRFSVDSNDEMGYLAATLSYMAGQIAKSEDSQKKFVANVSHDFRSPLTSIRGYLEAMLDGTIPPEMYDKYLTIVLNETERLTKLTNGLLTLNNLNNKGAVLEISVFDINQTIRKTVQTFEGICQKKQISIKLVLTGDLLPVKADEGMIQQVLYNLIDNAIKFSNTGSGIKIETTEKHNKVFVSVKDSGIGIPNDAQKMIFDRFYKTDLSRGKDKKGTGLGLSITKEILHAHGEHINVISTEGVGSEFIFTLPIVDVEEEE